MTYEQTITLAAAMLMANDDEDEKNHCVTKHRAVTAINTAAYLYKKAMEAADNEGKATFDH